MAENSVWIVLDDDPSILAVVEAMCKIWDVDLIRLEDGYQALKWLNDFMDGKYKGPLPELALLDMRMPGPQGYEIASMLRKTNKLKDMAIVLMSAYRLPPDEKERIMALSQADKFIQKPLPGMFEFNRMTRSLIEQRKQQNEDKEKTDKLNP